MIYSQIRGSFVREYAERDRGCWNRMNELISERDEKHRSLNRQFGYSEPDGTFSIGCKTHIDKVYKQKYDNIESEFRAVYDFLRPELNNWCLTQGITIYEFLFIDGIDANALAKIASECAGMPDWQIRFIQRKSNLFIARLKEMYTIAGIQKLIDVEMEGLRYARRRCRRSLNISMLDIWANKALFDYQSEWKKSIISEFGKLSVR